MLLEGVHLTMSLLVVTNSLVKLILSLVTDSRITSTKSQGCVEEGTSHEDSESCTEVAVVGAGQAGCFDVGEGSGSTEPVRITE